MSDIPSMLFAHPALRPVGLCYRAETDAMPARRLFAAVLISLLTVACDRDPGDPKKPATPPPDPKPVPSVPQASAAATQPNIVAAPATQSRGPDTPAVGSVRQPPVK